MRTRRTALVMLGGAAAAATSTFAGAQTQATRVRRNINQLAANHPTVALYAEAVKRLRARGLWTKLAEIHTYRCPHGNWFFLPWHRAYLNYFELICISALKEAPAIDGADQFALPYWDWATRSTVPTPFLDQNSPLYHPRDNTTLSSATFAATNIDRILRAQSFTVFGSSATRAQRSGEPSATGPLEGGPHNTVHSQIGADMVTYMSPLDPIFWLHHNNIDRLWDSWLALNHSNPSDLAFRNYRFRYVGQEASPPPTEYALGDFLNPAGSRVAPYVRDVLVSSALGYQFDALRGLTASTVSRLVSQRSNVSPFSAPTIAAEDRGFATVATAQFRLTRPSAALQIGDAANVAASPSRLREIFARQAPEALAVETPSQVQISRVIARITLTRPLPPGVTAQVLVNCPYLSIDNPADSPFFAGSIASFTHRDAHADHGDASQPARNSSTFVFDITDVLAEVGAQTSGGFAGNGLLGQDITIQIVPSDGSLNIALESAEIQAVPET